MTDLVPELRLIIGDQPPVPELEPQQSQSRFQLVFRRFIGAFAQPDHPLALFLDDLQWLDAATLDLLGDVLIRSDLRHLLLIGAYRDDEVDATHPLMRKLAMLRQAGATVQEICLKPLTRNDLGQLIAAALRCEPVRVAPLALLVHDKTASNPFFVMQFLRALAEEDLFTFDHDTACWRWNLQSILSELTSMVARLPLSSHTNNEAPRREWQGFGRIAHLKHLFGWIILPSRSIGTPLSSRYGSALATFDSCSQTPYLVVRRRGVEWGLLPLSHIDHNYDITQ